MSTVISRDPVEEGFLSQLRANPNDDETRLVYADWLEQHVSREGHKEKLELLRLQLSLKDLSANDPKFQASTEQIREIAKRVDQQWRMLVSRMPIEVCDQIRFDFVCPKQWTMLKPTTLGEYVRFCDACEKNVYYTQTVIEANERARQGHCVVVDLVELRRPNDLSLQPNGPSPNIPNIPMPAGGAMPMPMQVVPIVPDVSPVEVPPIVPPPAPAPSLFDKVRSFFSSAKK